MPHGLTYPFGEPLHQSHLPLHSTSSHSKRLGCAFILLLFLGDPQWVVPSSRLSQVVNGRRSREQPRRKSVIFIVAHIEQQTRHTAGTVSNRPHKSITDSRIPNSQRPLSTRVIHIMFYIYILCAALYSLKIFGTTKIASSGENLSLWASVFDVCCLDAWSGKYGIMQRTTRKTLKNGLERIRYTPFTSWKRSMYAYGKIPRDLFLPCLLPKVIS